MSTGLNSGQEPCDGPGAPHGAVATEAWPLRAQTFPRGLLQAQPRAERCVDASVVGVTLADGDLVRRQPAARV